MYPKMRFLSYYSAMFTHFTEEWQQLVAMVLLDGLVGERRAFVDFAEVLHPHPVVVHVVLLLTFEELVQSKVVAHHVRHRRIVRLKSIHLINIGPNLFIIF
jgi:hypothetical protein